MPEAIPSDSQNSALQTVVARRNWLCNCAGAIDASTAGWGAGTKWGAITIATARTRIAQLFDENSRNRPTAVATAVIAHHSWRMPSSAAAVPGGSRQSRYSATNTNE